MKKTEQVNEIMQAARERVRASRVEAENPDVFAILDRIITGAEVLKKRGQFFDVVIAEAERTGDSARVAELRIEFDEFLRDLQRFKFLAESAFEQLPMGEV